MTGLPKWLVVTTVILSLASLAFGAALAVGVSAVCAGVLGSSDAIKAGNAAGR